MNAPETVQTETQTMIEFEPFRAWRYNPEKVDFGQVIAPPYDVISPEQQQALYDRSPYNCIRLILNQEQASDNDQENRYSRAKAFYQEWQESGILLREDKPCFYLYRQTYKDLSGQERGRFALLGRLKLVPFEKGIVIPHEKTLAGPKKDRMALMEATESNFSPIFGLYPNAESGIADVLSKVSQDKPLYDVVDDAGVGQTLWAISESDQIETIRAEMKKQKAYIADGHHRYTTSLNYSEKFRKEKGIDSSDPIPSDYLLMALVHFDDPGLVLEPTHRILTKQEGFDVTKNLEAMKDYFDLEAMSASDLSARLKQEQEALQKDPNLKIQPSFGLLLENGESYLATLKDVNQAKQKMPEDRAEPWYSLDVNLVNYLVLAGLWNLPESAWEANIRFTHSDQGAISEIEKKAASAVFVLKAPHVKILEEMGKTGELMPQKSTYFYPKLASGFLFHQHSE